MKEEGPGGEGTTTRQHLHQHNSAGLIEEQQRADPQWSHT